MPFMWTFPLTYDNLCFEQVYHGRKQRKNKDPKWTGLPLISAEQMLQDSHSRSWELAVAIFGLSVPMDATTSRSTLDVFARVSGGLSRGMFERTSQNSKSIMRQCEQNQVIEAWHLYGD